MVEIPIEGAPTEVRTVAKKGLGKLWPLCRSMLESQVSPTGPRVKDVVPSVELLRSGEVFKG